MKRRHALLWSMLLVFAPAVQAANTDLATAPLITSAPQTVLPNVMFIMDDSGSMSWTHMPDDVTEFARTDGAEAYGYRSSQCNGVYYNPTIVYSAPVRADGTSYPDSSFTVAWINGYDQGLGTINLSSSFYAYADGSGGRENTLANSGMSGTDTVQAAYYYTYSGSQTTAAAKRYLDSSSDFYSECNSAIGSSPGSGVFAKVVVSSTSGPTGRVDERTNFANWFSYYRTRMLMMKTSTGRAFGSIGDQFRVGFMSINNNASPAFLNIGTFDATQKSAWYGKLYASVPSSGTPLREALSRAGRIYGAKISSLYGETVNDPVQYSCQKHFALLSTDGYWNGNEGIQIDGSTAIGNQDASEPRPYNDGGTSANEHRAAIEISGSGTTSVTGITINGTHQILSNATSSSDRSGTIASRVVDEIDDCETAVQGSCTVAGFRASRSGGTVTITAPASFGAITSINVVKTGGKTVTATVLPVAAVTSGGTSETLADVAMHYYRADLRDSTLSNGTGALGTDVTTNNVLPSGDDDATWQHMTTFTLGLGANGRMIYSSTYKSDASGDYAAVKNGSTASSSVCTWQSSGTTCNWPTPGSSNVENIDDLWHAAVNGRGSYFSAKDPASLAVGLSSALQGISALTSDAAAAATSNPNVTSSDNYVFSSAFRSGDWYGELERRQISVTTGEASSTADWQARTLLDAKAYATRSIYTFDGSATNKLRLFAWDNLTPAEKAYFTTSYVSATASPTLSQFCVSGEICLSSASQTSAGGAALVDYIRGDRSNEGGESDLSKYFRSRTSVLGDIVSSEAVFVKKPLFEYADLGYGAYRTAQASRQGMVYVGANDGMLHAFNADTGQEVWSYIPTMLMPKLYRLADKRYATRHQYFVDGSVTHADVYFDGMWHTVLIGGLAGGGAGYYALDVTSPASPKALWEVSPSVTGFGSMGLSYGRPEVTKLKDGTWVALLTSGYNNATGGGDGGGYLYVVNVATGALIRTISTGVGSTGAIAGICATAPCPSGLAQISTWVENTKYDNTTTRVYGGDLFGNVWRFDVNNDVGATGYDAQLLATLRGASGNIQSVTAKPELGKVGSYPVVFVGTGRYLGSTDLADASQQSIYAIKDRLDATSWGNPRLSTPSFVQQTLTDGTCGTTSSICTSGETIRTASSNAVNFATNGGWFVDLPGTRERANTDPQLALGVLAVTTNLLNPSACTVGGSSFINYFDYRTGSAVSTAGGILSVSLGSALATRPVVIRLPSGELFDIISKSDNTLETRRRPPPPPSSGTRRTSWRELTVR